MDPLKDQPQITTTTICPTRSVLTVPDGPGRRIEIDVRGGCRENRNLKGRLNWKDPNNMSSYIREARQAAGVDATPVLTLVATALLLHKTSNFTTLWSMWTG